MKTITKLILAVTVLVTHLTVANADMHTFASSCDTWKNKNQTTNVCLNGLNADSAECAVFSDAWWDALINALVSVESGGKLNVMGDQNRAAGCLQIHREVIQDVNFHYKTCYVWPRDAFDPHHARNICRLYLQIYCPIGATKERLSCCWNGGPTGWKKESTKKYWLKVKAVLNK